MSRHADCYCSAKFHFVQLGGKRGRTLQFARTPLKKLLPVRAVDLKSRRFTQKNRHFSVDPCLLQPRCSPHKERTQQRHKDRREHPHPPAWSTSRGLRALMSQSRQNPALEEKTLRIALKCPSDALIRGFQLLKKSRTFDAAVQMIKQRLKGLFVAARTPCIHLRSVQVAIHIPFTFLIFFTNVSAPGVARISCSNWRARESRDMTVPSGSSRASAISRYERS